MLQSRKILFLFICVFPLTSYAKINTNVGFSNPSISDFEGILPYFTILLERPFTNRIIGAIDYKRVLHLFPLETSIRPSIRYVFTDLKSGNFRFIDIYSSLGIRMRWSCDELVDLGVSEWKSFFSFFDLLTGINFYIPHVPLRIRFQAGLEYNFFHLTLKDNSIYQTIFFPTPSIVDMEYVYPRILIFAGVTL